MVRTPTISVVMPAYNAAEFIPEALETVLAQTRPAEEIVIVDDGSEDGTVAAVERYGDAVKLVRQENRGCAGAFNRAIQEASGDYVALCPADDLWEPRKLEWQAGALVAHPEIDVSFGHAITFGLMEEDYHPPQAGILDTDDFRRAMFTRNRIADPTAVVRRSLYERIGAYVLGPSEDYEFWLRALRAGAVFHYERRLLVRLRWHGGNLSGQALMQAEARYEYHRHYAADLRDERLVRDVLAADMHFIGRAHMGRGELSEARTAFARSLSHRRTAKTALFRALLSVPGAHPAIRAAYRATGRTPDASRDYAGIAPRAARRSA
jgi:glycosyltransferase involved in cell wall biosynthesis